MNLTKSRKVITIVLRYLLERETEVNTTLNCPVRGLDNVITNTNSVYISEMLEFINTFFQNHDLINVNTFFVNQSHLYSFTDFPNTDEEVSTSRKVCSGEVALRTQVV